jgi:hypothetical protein
MVSLMKRSAAADGRRRVRRPDIVATPNHFVGILAPNRQAQPKLPLFSSARGAPPFSLYSSPQ